MATYCCVCENKIGIFQEFDPLQFVDVETNRFIPVCSDCKGKSKSRIIPLRHKTKDEVREFILDRIETFKIFTPSFSQNIGTASTHKVMLEIDHENEIISIGGYAFFFNQFADFELVEDGYSYGKSGLGSALAGGALLGGAGAITGALLGGGGKHLVESLSLLVEFKDHPLESWSFDLIKMKLDIRKRMDSAIYSDIQKRYKSAAKELYKILEKQSLSQGVSLINESNFSLADELMKYKSLLDEGIISQDEFSKLKNDLINKDSL